ncbi:MAG: RluA family pseudouridine synthase [Clostridiales bacterium]|nr:RluA family pseudouridine synthase [Clostridiales bacterium]
MQEYIISGNDAGLRLDKFIAKAERGIPPSLMYRLIRQKKIKVNGKRADISYRLTEGDRVSVWMREPLPENDSVSEWINITPHIEIAYEDEDYIICDKKPGMLCHSDGSGDNDTLIGNIKSYLHIRGVYDPENENSFAPSLCNRIDRNTGGLVIAAKNARSLKRADELIRSRKVVKKYLCAVHGYFETKSAVLKAFLVKNGDTNTVKVYKDRHDLPEARTIITKYTVLKEKNGLSLIEAELLTGRTHQIRAHMSFIGHPLLGDGKYGVNKEDRAAGYRYQALYSYHLEIEDIVCEIPMENIWFTDLFK